MLKIPKAIAVAHPNIAFIKYWGNRDDALRLPSNGSISMNLGGLETRTSIEFSRSLNADELTLNGGPATDLALLRVVQFLQLVRQLAGIHTCARVESSSNFPTGVGIASSASAFAALALAASKATGLDLSEAELSRLARYGSGSACRSVPGGFVEWEAGKKDVDSFAHSIAPPEHWDLVDCIALISSEHKATGSAQGNTLAGSSPLQSARIADAPRRLQICRKAILEMDIDALAEIAELDSNLLHAVMMTSHPPLFYWQPATLAVMQFVRSEREKGLPAFYTIDAGPNVHVITPQVNSTRLTEMLREQPGVQNVLLASVGGPARLFVQ
jgi:diphosphomevalonate decarboxylase